MPSISSKLAAVLLGLAAALGAGEILVRVAPAHRRPPAPGPGKPPHPAARPARPRPHPLPPKPYEREHAEQHAFLAGIARREGFHHLDLRPAFRDCGLPLNELRFDRYHPTAAGQACAAASMSAAVRQILAAGG